jgi:hypothetical protein
MRLAASRVGAVDETGDQRNCIAHLSFEKPLAWFP